MHIKDLLLILVKITGIYFLISMMYSILPMLSMMGYGSYHSFDWLPILILLIPFYLIYVLIFQPSKIISTFRLDRGFSDNQVELGKFTGEKIIHLALLLTGLHLIISSIPHFFTNLYYLFKNSVSKNSYEEMMDPFLNTQVDYYTLSTCFISIVIGFLLLTNFKNIAQKIDRIHTKNK